MTVSPIWTVWCDREQLDLPDPEPVADPALLTAICHHWCVATGDTSPEATRQARDMGWHRIRTQEPHGWRHHDLCPPCHARYQAQQTATQGIDPT